MKLGMVEVLGKRLKKFCGIAYASVDSHNRSKLDEKSVKCIIVGYSSHPKHISYITLLMQSVIEMNVEFNELANWTWHKKFKACTLKFQM